RTRTSIQRNPASCGLLMQTTATRGTRIRSNPMCSAVAINRRHGTAITACRGTTTIEFAITCPIAFFVIFAIIVGGLGIFRYQQVAAAAREGARWASVHGGQYAQETKNPAATPSDIYTNAILPAANALDPSHLNYTV